MARATVEIEMPGSCAACPLEHDYLCMVMGTMLDDECSIFTERDKRCPLKETESAGEGAEGCNGDSCPIHFHGDR